MAPSSGVNLITAALNAPLVGIDTEATGPRVLHAVTMRTVIRAWDDPETLAWGPCGAGWLRLWSEAELALWPVQARLPEPFVRCQECWGLTGKRRPRSRIQQRAS
jgi:hypothetical protein